MPIEITDDRASRCRAPAHERQAFLLRALRLRIGEGLGHDASTL